MFKKMIVTVLVLVMVGGVGLFAQSPSQDESNYESPELGGYISTDDQWVVSQEGGEVQFQPLSEDNTVYLKIALTLRNSSGGGTVFMSFDSDDDGSLQNESLETFSFEESPKNRGEGIYWAREYWDENGEMRTDRLHMYYDVANDAHYVIVRGGSGVDLVIKLEYVGEL